jgi:hypothetical protein
VSRANVIAGSWWARFYATGELSCVTFSQASAVKDVNRRLHQGVDAFLMLGLPRATRMPWDDHRRHWLQLNGIRLADRTVGYVP